MPAPGAPAGRSTSARWPRRSAPTPIPRPPPRRRGPAPRPPGPTPSPGRPRGATRCTPPRSPPAAATGNARTGPGGSRAPPAPRGRHRPRRNRHGSAPGRSRRAGRSRSRAPWQERTAARHGRTATSRRASPRQTSWTTACLQAPALARSDHPLQASQAPMRRQRSSGASLLSGGDRQAGQPPLGHAVDQPAGGEALGPQPLDRLGGEHAVGAAAVGDDPGPLRQPRQGSLQLVQRDRQRARDVPGDKLLRRAHVEDHHVAAGGALHQLGAADRLQGVAGHEVVLDDPVHLRQAGPGQVPQRGDEAGDLLAGQPVVHPGGLLAGLHQAGVAQHLQVRRGVGHPHPGRPGEGLDGVLALGEQLQQLDPLGAGDRLVGAGELLVEPVLCLTTLHPPPFSDRPMLCGHGRRPAVHEQAGRRGPAAHLHYSKALWNTCSAWPRLVSNATTGEGRWARSSRSGTRGWATPPTWWTWATAAGWCWTARATPAPTWTPPPAAACGWPGPPRRTCTPTSSPAAASWPPTAPPSSRRPRPGSGSPIAAWATATSSTWAAWGCGRWPPPATPPSTWPSC